VKQFTRNLRYLVEEDLKLTPQQAARELDLAPSKVSHFLSGFWLPKADDLAQIGYRFGVSPHTLMTTEIVWKPTQEFEHIRFAIQVNQNSNKKLGVTRLQGVPKHLTKWTIDKEYPTADVLLRVARFYGTTIDEYLGVTLGNNDTFLDYLSSDNSSTVE
jgi:transcriptional regulator with XRE-family HTH domain